MSVKISTYNGQYIFEFPLCACRRIGGNKKSVLGKSVSGAKDAVKEFAGEIQTEALEKVVVSGPVLVYLMEDVQQLQRVVDPIETTNILAL